MVEQDIGISVIIPMYNAGQYLNECLDSILKQSFKKYEVICIDDGSTDNSLHISQRYSQKDRRIKTYTIPHSNAGNARNYGLKKAVGKYLLFLDADDYFHTGFFEEMYKKAEADVLDIVVCGAYTFDSETKKIDWYHTSLRHKFVTGKGVFTSREIAGHLFDFSGTYVWNKLFNRQYIEDKGIQFQSITKTNDLFFTQVALIEAERIAVIEEGFIYYRINNSNSLQGNKNGSNINFIEAHYAVKTYLEENGRWEAFRLSYLNQCVSSCLYNINNVNNYQSFHALYQILREEALFRTGIMDMADNEYYDICNCNEINAIVNYSCEEYLFKMFSKCTNILKLEYGKWQHGFPFEKMKPKSRIILYGAGEWGIQLYKQIMHTDYIELVAWVDIDPNKCQVGLMPAQNPEYIKTAEFDYIFIAVKERLAVENIVARLCSWGIGLEKIVSELSLVN